MRAEAASPEIDATPQTPNLLHVFAERHGALGAIKGNLMGLAGWCPRQDLFTRTDLNPDEQTKINDWVVKVANESGWDNIPEEYESLFAESISRQEFEPNVSFWSHEQNIGWKLEIEPSPTAKPELAAVTQRTAVSNKPVEGNATTSKLAATSRPTVSRAKVHEQTVAATRQLAPESMQAIMMQLTQTIPTPKVEISVAPLAKKPAKEVAKRVTHKMQPKIELTEPQRITKTLATTDKLVQPEAVETKAVMAKTVAPKSPTKRKVLPATRQSITIQVQPKPASKVEQAAKPAVASESPLATFQAVQSTEVAEPAEIFAETAEIQFADAPPTNVAQKLESLFEMGNIIQDQMTETDIFSRVIEAEQEPMPFSEQLEQIVTQEVTAVEQEPALQAIMEVKELVLPAIEGELPVIDKVAEIAAMVDIDATFSDLTILELAAELPISDELHAVVTELLQTLGLPEPTEQQVNRCIVKLRIEAITMQVEQAKADQFQDILHEKSRRPSVRDFVRILASPEFHQLLGQLAVYRPRVAVPSK